ANRLPNWRQIVYGLTIYPVATTALGGGVAVAWHWFVMGGASQSWRSLFTVASLMVTVMAVSLITTILPAALSRASRELAARGCGEGGCGWSGSLLSAKSVLRPTTRDAHPERSWTNCHIHLPARRRAQTSRYAISFNPLRRSQTRP